MSRHAMANAAVVFAKGRVADPMKTVLDVPVSSPPGEKLTRVGTSTRNAGDGVLRLDRLLATAQRAASESADLPQAGPIQVLG